jgi:hypothetical protein
MSEEDERRLREIIDEQMALENSSGITAAIGTKFKLAASMRTSMSCNFSRGLISTPPDRYEW